MRNPFADRPPLSTLHIFFVTAAVAAVAGAVAFMTDSTRLAIATLVVALSAFAIALPAFRALRAIGIDLLDHPDAAAMRSQLRTYARVMAAVMIAVMAAQIVRRYALGHRHEMVPWWSFYFLVMCLTPLQQQLRPPTPAKGTDWRNNLKPLHSDLWGHR